MPLFIHHIIDNYNTPEDQEIIAFLQKLIEKEHFVVGNINIIYTDNSEILDLNKNYLDHHYYTDVITFDYNEGQTLNGDIYISLDKVSENSQDYGTSFYNELLRVVIHGVLHLIGYKDKTDEEIQQMRSKEDLYLDQFYLDQ
jgi:rRNA maturation RNase YbeY